MKNWFHDNIASILMFLIGGAISAVVWVTSTFATVDVVKENKKEILEYADKGSDALIKRLDKMDDKLDYLVRKSK